MNYDGASSAFDSQPNSEDPQTIPSILMLIVSMPKQFNYGRNQFMVTALCMNLRGDKKQKQCTILWITLLTKLSIDTIV